MGYDNSWPVSGDLFEAETSCTRQHNMGQVASEGVNNLSFFTLKEAHSKPLPQPAGNITETFNPDSTYMSFVIGDGDNIAFMRGGRKKWFDDRVKYCEERKDSDKQCF